MEHITTENIEQSVPTAVTIGNFDGLHIGHRSLIDIMKNKATQNGLKSVVFSFYPHPMFVFGKDSDTKALILSHDEKKELIEEMGVDEYIEYPFTKEFSAMEPEDFAEKLLFEKLKCKVLVVGFNYHFGKKAAGNYELLKALGEKCGVEVICVPSINCDGERVSSTRIRSALVEGDIETVNRLLTEPYFVKGQVIHGKRLGHTIGFPTMNIEADEKKLFPPNGVYATRAYIDGKMYSAVTNVGVAPTVNGTKKLVETFVFDFDGDVYGKNVKVYFFSSLRPEHKFSSVEVLKEQLQKDAQNALRYFEGSKYEMWKNKY